MLSDGRTARIRPIRPEDSDRLATFHSHLSPQTIYYRYFAPLPELSAKDLKRFTNVDHVDRVALIAMVGDDIIGVARYDRIDIRDAEVAFTVRDDHQGRGIGSILLEHLAAAARERGVRRFVADVLPDNRRMIATFGDAGYVVGRRMEDGVIHLTFDIEITGDQLEVSERREHRAEARSIVHMLEPGTIAVIGASRTPGKLGYELMRMLLDQHPYADVWAVHPEAEEILGIRAFRSIAAVPSRVDTALIAVPSDQVAGVVEECGAAGVAVLVVISDGFAETGTPEGVARQGELVRLARANGMRVLGPNSLGFINTDPRAHLHASMATQLPPRGRAGLFTQSGALGVAALEAVTRRGVGISDFVNAGNRADISGNDLMQYWEADPDTALVLLYLESIGNPRKFTRIARRLSRRKPVVAVRPGRTTQLLPLGHRVRRTGLPPAAVDAVFAQSGVIQTRTLEELCDVAALVSYQPMPRGSSVAVVTNNEALGVLATGVAEAAGLVVTSSGSILPQGTSVDTFMEAVDRVIENPETHAGVIIHVPSPLGTSLEICNALRARSLESTKPLLLVLPALDARASGVVSGLVPVHGSTGAAERGSVPVYASVEQAVEAASRVAHYATWRRAVDSGLPSLPHVDPDRAEGLIDGWLAQGLPGGEDQPTVVQESSVDGSTGTVVELAHEQTRELLACFGIDLWPGIPVESEDEAVAAAESLGYPVVLKSLAPWLAHRIDLGSVRLNLESEFALRSAFLSMTAQLGPGSESLLVQRMASPGVSCVLAAVDDALFGPVVEFGISGPASALIGDRSYRIPPMSIEEADHLLRGARGAALLDGYRGTLPVDRLGLRDVALRLSRMIDDLSDVAFVRLEPVIVASKGTAVLGATIGVRRAVAPRRTERRLDRYE